MSFVSTFPQLVHIIEKIQAMEIASIAVLRRLITPTDDDAGYETFISGEL